MHSQSGAWERRKLEINYFEKRVKMSAEKIEKKEWVFFYVVKEFTKFVLFVFIFLTISGHIINSSAVYFSGGLIEYLKHDTLRLFTDNYYMDTVLGYSYSLNEYFAYLTKYLQVDLYLWIIPYCMAIICSYPGYWISHKLLDRSGVGATKRLSFFYFIFIFTISNILSRLFTYEVLLPITGINTGHILWWYIFYKVIKIGVLFLVPNVHVGNAYKN